MQKETISFSVDREHRGIGTVARSNSHRLWRVQDLTMLARDPLLPLAVLASSSRVVTWVATNETWFAGKTKSIGA